MTKTRNNLIYLSSLTFFLVISSHAEEKNINDYTLEELMNITISSTSFFEQKISEAPGYVQVFDFTKLRLGGHYSLSDLLEHYAVGSTIGSHVRHGALHGVRGVLIDNSAKTLIMVNGQQINPRAHFGASLTLNSPFLGDFRKAEVINGPGAIIHGSGAINGFINLVPKQGDLNEGGFAQVTYGLRDQMKKFESGYGMKLGENHNLYIYGGVIEADGFTPDIGWGQTKSEYADYETRAWEDNNFKLSSYWNYHNFSLQAIYQELNSSIQTKNLDPNSNGDPFHTASLAIQPKLTIDLTDSESLEIIESLFWHEHALERSSNESGGGREWHWDNKLILRTTRLEDHSIAIGGSYGMKKFDAGSQFFQTDTKGLLEAVDTDWQEYSLFAEDNWQLTSNLTISLGLRYDKYLMDEVKTIGIAYTPEDGDELSPRVALAYKINESHNIKLSYQHGFRMPDAAYYDWFTQNNAAAEALGYPTATLEPETMDSYELNYNWEYSQNLQLGLNLFYNEFENQLAWGALQNIWTDAQVTAINAYNGVGWGGGQFQNNLEKSEAYGGEFIVNYQLLDNTKVNLSYGYVKLAGVAVQRYPSHQLKLNLTSQFMNDKLTVGTNYLVNSNYDNDETPGRHEIYSRTRHLVDIFMDYKISNQWTGRVSIENLFESDVPRMGIGQANPQAGNLGADSRMIYFSLTYNF